MPFLQESDNHILNQHGSLQKNAKQNETFSPNYISLTPDQYEQMVRTMRLPFRAIEGTSVVGPFFWAAFDQDASDPHLRK